MDHIPDEAGRIASDYVGKHGRDALVYLDGDIAKALGTQRWDDYKLLHQVRLRMRRQFVIGQAEEKVRNGSPKLAGGF